MSMINMNLGGYAGRRVGENTERWLHKALEHNPGMFAAFADPEGSTVFKTMWHGEFPGKILAGMAQALRLFGLPETRRAGDAMVDRFKAVQGEDGYLGPWPVATRFDGDRNKWDTWGHYHCIIGLYQWYLATGNRDALDVAVAAADCIYNHFIGGNRRFVAQNWAECNFAIAHGFALLQQETGRPEYLEAAEYIIQDELKLEYEDFYTKRVLACDWLTAAKQGKAYYQSNQTRWEGLHVLLALAPLYEITGKQEYYDTLAHYWQSIVDCDRHNFGGFGTGEAAEGKPYTGGSETCNTVAWMALSTEFLKLSKRSTVADELELSFFNAALGSLAENSYEFSYMNPMSGNRDSALQVLAEHGFEGGRELSCCQANGARGITQLAEWAVLSDGDSMYINFYGTSNMELLTPAGKKLKLEQQTDYPRSGSVKLVLSLPPENDKAEGERFTLLLRIPAWSASTSVALNGVALSGMEAGGYYPIQREWKDGDIIELSLDMAIRYWKGEQECAGKESIFWGPILMARKQLQPGSAAGVEGSNEIRRQAIEGWTLRDEQPYLLYATVSSTGQRQVPLMAFADAWLDRQPYETWLVITD